MWGRSEGAGSARTADTGRRAAHRALTTIARTINDTDAS